MKNELDWVSRIQEFNRQREEMRIEKVSREQSILQSRQELFTKLDVLGLLKTVRDQLWGMGDVVQNCSDNEVTCLLSAEWLMFWPQWSEKFEDFDRDSDGASYSIGRSMHTFSPLLERFERRITIQARTCPDEPNFREVAEGRPPIRYGLTQICLLERIEDNPRGGQQNFLNNFCIGNHEKLKKYITIWAGRVMPSQSKRHSGDEVFAENEEQCGNILTQMITEVLAKQLEKYKKPIDLKNENLHAVFGAVQQGLVTLPTGFEHYLA